VVLQTDHTILWNRLEARYVLRMSDTNGRGYSLQKIQENNEAEIMQVVLSEAQESYKEGIIMVVPSDSVEQQDENVERIVQWLNNWGATRR
jgi:adenylate kinase